MDLSRHVAFALMMKANISCSQLWSTGTNIINNYVPFSPRSLKERVCFLIIFPLGLITYSESTKSVNDDVPLQANFIVLPPYL